MSIARSRLRRIAIAPGVLAVVIAACALVIGPTARAEGATHASRVAHAGVSLSLPARWASRASGPTLIVAHDVADLTALVPIHGRLTFRALGCGSLNLNQILTRDTDLITTSAAPTTTSVDGHRAAIVSFTSVVHGRTVVTVDAVIPLGPARAYVMTFVTAQQGVKASTLAMAPVVASALFARTARCP